MYICIYVCREREIHTVCMIYNVEINANMCKGARM